MKYTALVLQYGDNVMYKSTFKVAT